MIAQRELPHVNDLVDYSFAVAGHEGTKCDIDGSMFIKPCTQNEIDFYYSASTNHPDFAQLMPTCFGALRLMGTTTNVKSLDAHLEAQLPVLAKHLSPEIKEQVTKVVQHVQSEPEPAAATASVVTQETNWTPNKNRKLKTDVAIALKNAAYGFKRPNILDCKLGVRLWADDAPKEKRERFDKISAQTTHKNFGFRIAGMRVYQGSEDSEELDEAGYKVYDKDYGRFSINDENVLKAFRKFLHSKRAGMDAELARLVAGIFLKDLQYIQKVLEQEESRMYSASLLFVFEGDGETLRATLGDMRASQTVLANANEKAERFDQSAVRVDSGIDMGEDGDLIFLDEESDMSDKSSFVRVHALNLIDFAHAEWTPGQGPDENCLKGVRSLIQIFEELTQDT